MENYSIATPDMMSSLDANKQIMQNNASNQIWLHSVYTEANESNLN